MLARVAAVTVVSWLPAHTPAFAADSHNVLVLYSNNRLVPGNVAVDRGLRAGLAADTSRRVQLYSEFLDRPEFSGADYEATVGTYLREKYAAKPPDAIVAVSDESLDFMLRHRAALFAGVPLVYTAVADSFLRSLPSLPPDAYGVAFEYEYAGTIEQALRWHPSARTLVVVTGASERDREREVRLRREVPRVAPGMSVEFVAGLPTAQVLDRLRRLDAQAVVFTPGYFVDGDGTVFNPRDSAALMAAASAAPLYGPLDTFIGIGAVGGRMPSFEGMGAQAAAILAQIFAGAPPPAGSLPRKLPTPLHVDWRQVRRWGIDEKLVPADAIVHFREPTFWEQYRVVAIVATTVILLQAALIGALLLERRRRRLAEIAVQKQRIELAHASRLAVAGELTASIAHEINQPLGAVQTSADAADLLLQSGGDRREDLLRIVTRIRRDNLRASDVIRRLRTLLARHEPDRHPFDLGVAMNDVAAFLRAEARRRDVTLDFRDDGQEHRVLGDQTQIQQVLINLVLNAMDAVADLEPGRRAVVIAAERRSATIDITVRDRGRGVAAAHLPRLFDSFYSTKQKGMGLGLSIARTIVEAHGGRIFAASVEGAGTTFTVELPICDGVDVPAASPA